MKMMAPALIVTLSLLMMPLTAEEQPVGKIPVIDVLRPGYASFDEDPKNSLSAFRQGLRELGYIEAQTIRLEYRAAEWQLDRLPELAAELVRLTPDMLVTNKTLAALAAKQATAAVPILIAGHLQTALPLPEHPRTHLGNHCPGRLCSYVWGRVWGGAGCPRQRRYKL
jgi:ABC-type uncharacterized transport system substrate-binding protein